MRTTTTTPWSSLPIYALLFLFVSPLHSQGWERTFGPGFPHSLYVNSDGSSWLFYTNNNLYARHVSASGDSLGLVGLGWAGTDVWPTGDGGFIKAGKRGGWYGLDSLAVEKRMASGQVVWKRHFADTVLLNGVAMAPAANGQYWLASLPQHFIGQQPFLSMTKRLTLRRLNATGEVLAESVYIDDLPFLSGVSLRQMAVLADGSVVLLLNVSYSGDDRSFRLWKFGPAGNFIQALPVEAESSFTSGYSLNIDAESNLYLASEWASQGAHQAVWRSWSAGGDLKFHEIVAAQPSGASTFHQPAPLAFTRLSCGTYLSLLHLDNFTLEAWSPAGERIWQHPVPGPSSPGYYTPGYPPARFGRFLASTADGGGLAAVPENGRIRLMKADCSGLTSAAGAQVRGRVVYDANGNCKVDDEESSYPYMAFTLQRSDGASSWIWTDEQGRFTLPLDTGAWVLQPTAAGSTLTLPEPSPGCPFSTALLIGADSENINIDFLLAPGTVPAPVPSAETSPWSVFPNPVSDLLMVNGKGQTGPVRATVWTAQGQVVFSGGLEEQGEQTWVVSAGSWPPGAYTVRLESRQGIHQVKVVKAGQ